MLGRGKKKVFSPQNLLQPFNYKSKVMPVAKKMKITTSVALLQLLDGHNALNLTTTTASVSAYRCYFYILRRANGQLVCMLFSSYLLLDFISVH